MSDNEKYLDVMQPLPQGRHVTVLAYWQDEKFPQPGDAVIRNALRTLGQNTDMCDVAIPISQKSEPSFAGIIVEALKPGIPVGAVYNALKDLQATSYKVVEQEEIPEWIADMWDGAQGAKDTGAVFVDEIKKVGKLASSYGREILIGLVVAVVSYHVIKAAKEIKG